MLRAPSVDSHDNILKVKIEKLKFGLSKEFEAAMNTTLLS